MNRPYSLHEIREMLFFCPEGCARLYLMAHGVTIPEFRVHSKEEEEFQQ